MKRISSFIKTTLIGGFGILLPIFVMLYIFGFLFNLVGKIVSPITGLLFHGSNLEGIIGNVISLLIIVFICFIIGVIVRTRIGSFVHNVIEKKLLNNIPGYNLIKETIKQFTGGEEIPFSSVAIVKLYGSDTMATGFITDKHSNGIYTVFVPTGPNPTSGNIFHLEGKYVTKIDISVEHAMKSIIGCGTGSSKFFENYNKKK